MGVGGTIIGSFGEDRLSDLKESRFLKKEINVIESRKKI